MTGKDFDLCLQKYTQSGLIGRWKMLPMLLLSVAALIHHGTAQAGVYRCKDDAGKIAYSQTPCPAEHQSEQMRGINSTVRQDKELCRSARDLGMHTFTEIRNGSEPAVVIDEFGGLNYINPPTLSVINFAASLRYNTDVTPQRVGAMTFARCTEGGFGKLVDGDLPAFDDKGVLNTQAHERKEPGSDKP